MLQPLYCLNQMKSAGLVSSATTVAARVRRRHWSASSVETAACGRTNPASGCSAVAILGLLGRGGPSLVSGRLSAFVLHPTRGRGYEHQSRTQLPRSSLPRDPRRPPARAGRDRPVGLHVGRPGRARDRGRASRRTRRVSARWPDRRPLGPCAAAAHRLAGAAARAPLRLLAGIELRLRARPAEGRDDRCRSDRARPRGSRPLCPRVSVRVASGCRRRCGAPRPPAHVRCADRPRAGLQPLRSARGLWAPRCRVPARGSLTRARPRGARGRCEPARRRS